MEVKGSVVLCLIVTMMMVECSSGAPPPPPSSSFTCLAELMLCQGAGSTPSTGCCNTLKRVYDNEQTCLCGFINAENATSQLGMNGTQVSDLLVDCDIVNATTSTTFCNATSPFPAPNLPFTPGSPFPFLTPPVSVQAPPPPSEDSAMYNKATWVWAGLPCFLLFIFLGWI